ncbi:MAG: aminopeptidase [Theionarchaea archaeon]|nr:aminopeptidase [Theionarchaea archaeon]MBU7037354.1 aminopeptidase [Theionarchaea archaeon]
MADIRMERLADLIVNYSVSAQKGQEIFIIGPTISYPMIEQLYKYVLLAKAYPTVIFLDERLDDIQFRYGEDHQLQHVPLLSRHAVEEADILIRVKAERNPRHLANVETGKIAKNVASRREISDIMSERIRKGELSWNLVPFPTESMAQEGSMNLMDYEDFVYKACFAHVDEPKKEWMKVSEHQQKIVDYLGRKSELRYVGEDTDITFAIKGRIWINADGKKNMPDGEVFTGPLEDSAEGTIRFTYPAIYSGNEVEDIRLTFKKGVVTEARARKGEELLRQMVGLDEGSNRVGEVAIGTNYEVTQFTKDMLFDEKMGGTIHMALGRGIPETGSEIMSAIHWDMLKDMRKGGKIFADGELFYENGKFLI